MIVRHDMTDLRIDHTKRAVRRVRVRVACRLATYVMDNRLMDQRRDHPRCPVLRLGRPVLIAESPTRHTVIRHTSSRHYAGDQRSDHCPPAADESRFLLDPGRADMYSLAYLDKSQTVLYVASGNLPEYYTALSASMTAYRANPRNVGFLGFYGDEARAHPGPAVTTVLARYQQFQADDQRIRQLVHAGQDRQAVKLLTGRTAGSAGYDFDQYDQAVVSLTGQHRATFDQTIRAGDGELGRSVLGNWAVLLPLAALGVAVLVVAGIWARLAEYR